MPDFITDFDESEMLQKIDDNTAIDAEGNLFMRMGDHMIVNMETGETHCTSDWDEN